MALFPTFRQTIFVLVTLLICHATSPMQLCAENWPQRTVKFILPLGPGSGTDIGARLFAERLAARWRQPVVVENRPGGDGIIAITTFVNAHDDHILLFSPSGTFTVHPFMHDKLPYDAGDLVPIARVSNTVLGIAVPAILRVGSLTELIELVRSRPATLNWAPTSGLVDIVTSAFLKTADLNMARVPYRDTVQGLNDLIEGRIQMYVAALATVRPQMEAGKIKIVALTNRERSPLSPDVPTAFEAGFPGLTVEGLVGLFGPRNMSSDTRERIAADVLALAADQTIGAGLAATGQVLNAGTPADFAASIEEQRARVATAAKDLGLKPAR
jgi:tripartite-type tricarboxylate transporter receptor subunit TctC